MNWSAGLDIPILLPISLYLSFAVTSAFNLLGSSETQNMKVFYTF